MTPNLLRPDGTQDPADLGAEYAVASKGVAIAAPQVTTVGDYVLYRLGGEPVRLREATAGVQADGWMSSEASYTRYDVEGLAARVREGVAVARRARASRGCQPAKGVVTVGAVGVNEFDQPGHRARDGPARGRRQRVPAESRRAAACRPSRGGSRSRVDPTFVPNELDSATRRPPRARCRPFFEFLAHDVRAAARLHACPMRQRSARRRSGCLRTNRSMPLRCQRVWRERKRLSITAA